MGQAPWAWTSLFWAVGGWGSVPGRWGRKRSLGRCLSRYSRSAALLATSVQEHLPGRVAWLPPALFLFHRFCFKMCCCTFCKKASLDTTALSDFVEVQEERDPGGSGAGAGPSLSRGKLSVAPSTNRRLNAEVSEI